MTATNPIVVKGYKLFDSVTGEEFVARGIDYYPRPNAGDLNRNSIDFFSEEYRSIWERDILSFIKLGVNAIRLYAVNATKNHDAFMCALEAAGIYVVVALAHDCPTCAITSDEAPNCYPPALKEQGQAVINAFAKYPNTLAFSAGNEVNHFAPVGKPEWNAPCQKKFLRDMREYMDGCHRKSKGHIRKIPVGLVSADTDRKAISEYYNCQSNKSDVYENAEWHGINAYVNCDGEDKEYSDALGLQLLAESYRDMHYSIPVLLTEFGCLSTSFPTVGGYVGQRTFYEAEWMQDQQELREQFDGGFVFEYSIEKGNDASPYPFKEFGHSNYGIGYFSPEDCDEITIPCDYNPMPAFNFLRLAFQKGRENMKLTTIEHFKVDDDRQGRSECPSNFLPIEAFEWEADAHPSLSCFNDFNKPPEPHACPPISPALLSAIGASKAVKVAPAESKAMEVWALAAIFVCFLVGALWLVYNPKKKESSIRGVSFFSGIPVLMRHREPSKQTDTFNDADSEQSGLLSTKSLQENSTSPQTNYHAVG